VIASLPSPSSGVLELGPLSLRAYGLCIALGAFAAVRFASSRQDRRGGPPGLVEAIAWWAVPAGLLGARLYHVITDWNRGNPSYADEPLRILRIWEGGLGIWGGVAVGTAVGYFVAEKRARGASEGGGSRARGIRLLDVAAPAIPIAQALGRFGNWFNQELFGRPTDLPWGLRIDPEHRPSQFSGNGTFHPTFLYESLWCLVVVALLLGIERRKRLKPGQLFALYVALYTAGRWVIETVRVDEATHVGGFRVNELVAPAVGTLAVLAFFILGRRNEEALTAPELEALGSARTGEAAEQGDAAPSDTPGGTPAEEPGSGPAGSTASATADPPAGPPPPGAGTTAES